jgi:hypothetical protein
VNHFGRTATAYATTVYNHTPRYHLGRQDMIAPIQLYTKEVHTMKHFQPFGCRSYVHIPSQIRRKNHRGRAELAIFVGMDPSVIHGYKFYRPMYRDYITSGHAKFVPLNSQGSNLIQNDTTDMNAISDTIEGTLNDFLYLAREFISP